MQEYIDYNGCSCTLPPIHSEKDGSNRRNDLNQGLISNLGYNHTYAHDTNDQQQESEPYSHDCWKRRPIYYNENYNRALIVAQANNNARFDRTGKYKKITDLPKVEFTREEKQFKMRVIDPQLYDACSTKQVPTYTPHTTIQLLDKPPAKLTCLHARRRPVAPDARQSGPTGHHGNVKDSIYEASRIVRVHCPDKWWEGVPRSTPREEKMFFPRGLK